MLNWLETFSTFCFLDNHQYNYLPHQYDCLVAAGIETFIEGENLDLLETFIADKPWVFGHLGYHLSAAIHQLAFKKDKVGFAPYYFFAPSVVLEIEKNTVRIEAEDPENIFTTICQTAIVKPGKGNMITVQPVLDKKNYVKKIKALQQHILRGDCYEINFCQEFFATAAQLNPFTTYQNLAAVSPNPFSAFYRVRDQFLLCASPERFITKQGGRIFSQPMKGTAKRDLLNEKRDEELKGQLKNSPKDQAENVMVVDLVRNDLTRICEAASVQVDELFGVYSYPQVHQMVSTISGQLAPPYSFSHIIKATFPMGSMTGAPKRRVMQLIEQYEPSARGIFSGAVGYINPAKDFDFNVVIRSIMYNSATRYLSYQVGSGITFYSQPEQEWEECLLKASAIKQVLEEAG